MSTDVHEPLAPEVPDGRVKLVAAHVETDLAAKLKRIAQANGRTVSGEVRQLIRLHIEDTEREAA